MKITVCDVCAAEGQLTKSVVRSGFTRNEKVDLCNQHRGWVNQFRNDVQGFNQAAVDLMKKAYSSSLPVSPKAHISQ